MADTTDRKQRNSIPVSTILGAAPEPNEKSIDTGRVFSLSLQAIINAIVIGLIAKVLVALISLITNLSFYGK